jgi:hypothetical protein
MMAAAQRFAAGDNIHCTAFAFGGDGSTSSEHWSEPYKVCFLFNFGCGELKGFDQQSIQRGNLFRIRYAPAMSPTLNVSPNRILFDANTSTPPSCGSKKIWPAFVTLRTRPVIIVM